jgi:heme exporter protein A
MLTVHQLQYDLPEKPLLYDVSFTLKAGELLHVRGENGVGKTTLFQLIAGLLIPDAGEVLWDGLPVHQYLAEHPASLAYVGHALGFNPLLTVREALMFDVYSSMHFGVEALLDVPCMDLSAGQQRRVALMRIFNPVATLWLLDEPFNALDANMTTELTSLMVAHCRQGGMVVVTSHMPLSCEGMIYQELILPCA